MAVTLSANGLTVVHVGSEGKAMADLPDFCKTPVGTSTPPLPYPNKAESKDLDTGLCSMTVKADGGNPIAVLGSVISKSSGDKAGVCGGVVSGGTEGKGIFFTCSPDVMIESRPVIRKTDKLLMNDINTICLSGIDQADVSPPQEIQVQLVPFKIQLKEDNEPKANMGFKLIALKMKIEGTTDGDGKIDVQIPEQCTQVRIKLEDGYRVNIEIGPLPTGDKLVQAQLTNLGLYEGRLDGRVKKLTQKAITKFQKLTEDLKVDNVAGPKTKNKLNSFTQQ